MRTEHPKAAWFREARFGVFVHWGLFALPGVDMFQLFEEETPLAEYDAFADRFTPRAFDADEWAATAKAAGARYMVMVARHHDGFALWDSAVSDFTSARTAAGRDFIGEYVAAARRADLGVGIYYSLLDWRIPAYFAGPALDPDGWDAYIEYVHAQVRELCTEYGPLDILWYDGAWPHNAAAWRSAELEDMVRGLQPGILINDRAWLPGDFLTPEQTIGAGRDELWESCMTMNDHWDYCVTDDNWKSAARLVACLVSCAAGGGNLLLNVGPDPDGRIPPESTTRLAEMGRWLAANGDAIYGTRDAPSLRHVQFPADTPWGGGSEGSPTTAHVATIRGNDLNLYVGNWRGERLAIGNLAFETRSVRFLDGGAPIPFRQEGTRLVLSGLPAEAPDPLGTVIVIEADRPPATVDRFAPHLRDLGGR